MKAAPASFAATTGASSGGARNRRKKGIDEAAWDQKQAIDAVQDQRPQDEIRAEQAEPPSRRKIARRGGQIFAWTSFDAQALRR